MKAGATTQRASDGLDAVLEKHGLERAAFDRLRPESFEHALARRNPAGLDALYTLIFAPGVTLAELVERAPAWPAGTRRAGAKPSDALLSDIRRRWRAEKALDSFAAVNKFVDGLQARLNVLPKAKAEPVTDAILAILGQEMLTAKLDGMPVADQLKAVDRLLAKQKLEFQAEEQRLARQRFERETCELFLKWQADARAREVAESGASQADKLAALGRLMFGEHFDALESPRTREGGRMTSESSARAKQFCRPSAAICSGDLKGGRS